MYIARDRTIYSVNVKLLGARWPEVTESPSSIYVNGLNITEDAEIYITSEEDMFDSQDPILVDGEDSGYTGKLFEFELESSYSLKIPSVDFNTSGEIDIIVVQDGLMNVLSENYEYGYHKITVVLAPAEEEPGEPAEEDPVEEDPVEEDPVEGELPEGESAG